jgi:hypothetical protein
MRRSGVNVGNVSNGSNVVPIVDDARTTSPDLSAMPIERLRSERMEARRALELAHLRMRQEGGGGQALVDSLHRRVAGLTDELIRRYAADLTLVDGLLDAGAAGRQAGR